MLKYDFKIKHDLYFKIEQIMKLVVDKWKKNVLIKYFIY